MRELVRIAEPEAVLELARRVARPRGSSCCAASGSTPSFDVANDPFFGRSGRMMAASQREQALKFEIAGPDRGARADRRGVVQLPPGPLRRARTGSRSPTAAMAHTACLGFGLERIVLALLRTHGLDPAAWPDAVRAELWGRMSGRRHRHASACSAGPGDLRAARRSTRPAAPTPRPTATADMLIELLHARGHEPLAALGHAGAHGLRGRPVDVLQAAARGPRAAVRHRHPRDAALPAAARADRRAARAGRTIIVELDSWYLPDTAATSYRTEHVKTSIAAEAIDRDGELLRYFHNTGCYELHGEDYRGVFRLGGLSDRRPAALHRARALRRRPAPARRGAARAPPRSCCGATSPGARAGNPFARFGRQLERDLPGAARGGPPTTTPTPSRPCGWSARPSSSSPRTRAGCSGDAGAGRGRRACARSSTAPSCCRSSSRGGARSTPRR